MTRDAVSTGEIPGFTMGAELGRGAMGRVYDARHDASGAAVAMKIVQASRPGELDNEILAMARLNHRRLLYLYDFGEVFVEDRRFAWMALERVSGGSLDRWVPASWAEVVPVLDGVLEGLAHAHAHAVVHRDIKPENILMSTDEDLRPGLKIADFGLSWASDGKHRAIRGGTPYFIPPEQYLRSAGEPGPASDLYSVAAMVWLWTTGGPVYSHDDPHACARAHVDEPLPPYLPRFEVPWRVHTLLAWMLQKRPEQRPHTVGEVCRIVDGHTGSRLTSRPITPTPTVPLPGIGVGMLGVRRPQTVGRTDERAALWSAVSTLLEGGRPQCVLLTGAPGVGRRHLMAWLAGQVAEQDCAEVLANPLDASEVMQSAARRPTVAWTDSAGDALGDLFAGVAFSGLPILMVGWSDRAASVPGASSLEGFTEIPLRPLGEASLRRLLSLELGLDQESALRLGTRCGGNVAIALAWVRQLAREGRFSSTPAGFQLHASPLGPVPSVDEAVRREVDTVLAAMGGADRQSLELGALMGTAVDLDEWKAAHTAAGATLAVEGVRELGKAGMTGRKGTGFRFAHPQVRARVLEGVEAPEARHRFIALGLQTLDADPARNVRIGQHWVNAGEPRRALDVLVPLIDIDIDEELAHALLGALTESQGEATTEESAGIELLAANLLAPHRNAVAAEAAARGLLQLADELPVTSHLAQRCRVRAAQDLCLVGHPETALRILESVPPTMASRQAQAWALWEVKRFEEALELLKAVLPEASEPLHRIRALNGMAAMEATLGRPERAKPLLMKALQLSDQGKAVLLVNLAACCTQLGLRDQALAHVEQAIGCCELLMGHRASSTARLSYAVVAAIWGDDDLLDRTIDYALFVLAAGSPAYDISVLLPGIEAALAGEPSPAAAHLLHAVLERYG